MPTLKYFATAGAPRMYCVHKPLTTIGKALGNDVPIVGAGVADHHAQILFDGRDFVLEFPIHADFAFVKARQADRWGNLVYRKTARNFGPVMATAAACTIAQVDEIVELGTLDPEAVVTPGIFVQGLVEVSDPAQEEDLNRAGAKYPQVSA